MVSFQNYFSDSAVEFLIQKHCRRAISDMLTNVCPHYITFPHDYFFMITRLTNVVFRKKLQTT